MASDGSTRRVLISGARVDWLSVRLLIRSKEVIPSIVTAALGVQPDVAHEPGARVLRRDGSLGRVEAEGVWQRVIDQREVEADDFDAAAKAMLSVLPEDPVVWGSLPARAELIISIGLPIPNCYAQVSLELMRLLTERGIALVFDIYGESLWSEDEA